MSNPNSKLFRQAALDRLASPEQLDQLMRLVSLRHWVPLGTMGALVATALVWGVVGRIPVKVQGRGALVDPKLAVGASSVVSDLVAPGAGTLSSMKVALGQSVRAGEVVATIAQPELEAQLADAEARLRLVDHGQEVLNPLQSTRTRLNAGSLQAQRAALQRQLQEAQRITPEVQRQQALALRSQMKALDERLENARRIALRVQEGMAGKRELQAKGLIPDSAFLQAEREALGAQEQVTELEGQRQQLAAQAAQARQGMLEQNANLASLRNRLLELELQGKVGQLDDAGRQEGNLRDLDEAKRLVARLKEQLSKQGEVKAGASGRVLELTAVVGQMVGPGQRLGGVAVQDDLATGPKAPVLDGVAYFSVGDGMRVKPGMLVQLSPDTIQREEFGGIVGRVASVSSFPITTAGAQNVLSNQALAEQLTGDGRLIQVFIDLEVDPSTHSGYRWSSSKGPPTQLAIGTTSGVQITLERRAPITYVLPFLRAFFGTQ